MDFSNIRSTESRSSVMRADSRPFTLQKGQMVHGQIKTLFPGQLAEVQIGNERIIAKLEVPLKAGDAYYFQVHTAEPEFQLKIVAGPTGKTGDSGEQLTKLIEAMQLSKTTEMKALLSFIMKHKIPMNQEGLLQAESFLKTVPHTMRQAAFAAIQKTAERQLPFTETVFRALFDAQSKEGFQPLLGALKEALVGDTTVAPATKQAIIASLSEMNRPFTEAVSNALLGNMTGMLLDRSERPDMRFAIVQLLKKEGLLPATTSLANLSQVLLTMAEKNLPENFQNVAKNIEGHSTGPSSNEAVTQMIRKLAENAIATPFRTNEEGKASLSALFGLKNGSEIAERLTSFLRTVGHSNHAALQPLLQSAETTVANAVEGTAMKDAMQTVIRSLGFNYEAVLGEQDADISRLMESLKPQLLALMQDENVSQAVRNQAELVISRLNGTVLLSGETGVQHQLVTQIPLEFFGNRIDATLQWNGKMKEDGKIDPEFARILFYLELNSLQETVIDMQVQNRIVSITVYNADSILQSISAPLQKKLKEGLEVAGYQLSGVFFKAFSPEEKNDQPFASQPVIRREGVDLRI